MKKAGIALGQHAWNATPLWIGVAGLALLLDGCRIQSPMDPTEVRAAEQIKAAGGKVKTEPIASNDFADSIVSVDFANVPIGDSALESFCLLPNLRKVILKGTKVTDEGIAKLKPVGSLEFLDLSNTGVTGKTLKDLRATRLQVIDLSHSGLTDAGMESLKYLVFVNTLDLCGTKITDAGLEYLADLRALETLDLSGTRIVGPGAKQFPPTLKQLNLADTPLDDIGLAHLEGLLAVEKLDLSRTKITDDGLTQIKSLAETQNSTFARRKLVELNLTGTKTTNKGVDLLQKSLPSMKIVR